MTEFQEILTESLFVMVNETLVSSSIQIELLMLTAKTETAEFT